MGVSLSQIKEYLSSRSPEKFAKLLDDNEKMLDEEINKLKSIKKLIRTKSDSIKQYLTASTQEIDISTHKEEFLFITQIIDDDVHVSLANHINNVNKFGVQLYYSVRFLTKMIDFDYDNSLVYYVSEVDAPSEYTQIKPAGTYLNYYHKDGYFTVNQAYEKIQNYVQANGIALSENIYEDVILDELSVVGMENTVIRISVQIIY